MRGDLPILAALLGVGVVVSPLVSGRAGEAAPLALGTAPRSEPAAAPPAPALDVESDAADAARIEPVLRAPVANAPNPVVQVAPAASSIVIEATSDRPLAALGAIADRAFALVLGESGIERPTRIDGALSLDGRPLLVHVAASWCAPCVEELPTLLALSDEALALGARVVLVAAEEVAGPSGLLNAIDALVGRAEPTSRALPVGLELRADPSWAWAAWLGREALPVTAVVDARGGLVMVVAGALDRDAAGRVLMRLGGDP